jgi:hypothetical protein
MKCPSCGNPLEAEAHFCPKCFAPIAAPTFWQKVASFFLSGKPRRPLISIKKTITIKSTDKDGVQHEYHSLDQVPPDLAAEIKKLEGHTLKDVSKEFVSDGPTYNLTIKKSVSVFRIRDASGKERVFHSLEEIPPELRAIVEKARGNH